MAKDIRVLLYYKYVPIENAEKFAADHLAFCKSIGLKGRILVADEGINGTVSGDYETTQKYMDYVHSLPGMEDLWFEVSVFWGLRLRLTLAALIYPTFSTVWQHIIVD